MSNIHFGHIFSAGGKDLKIKSVSQKLPVFGSIQHIFGASNIMLMDKIESQGIM